MGGCADWEGVASGMKNPILDAFVEQMCRSLRESKIVIAGTLLQEEAKWFRDSLKTLGLTQTECAKLFRVSRKTVNRWAKSGVRKPSPAYRAIEAWLKCQKAGIDWRSL